MEASQLIWLSKFQINTEISLDLCGIFFRKPDLYEDGMAIILFKSIFRYLWKRLLGTFE